MPLSSVTRVSDGIQKQYDFNFGYLRKSHIFVFVNDQLRAFKWIGPFQIELLNFPQPDDRVTIRRLTDRVNRITTFTDGQTILAEDLNASDLQTFYIAQEMLDQIEERILAGELSVVGAGYITSQWLQEQLEANIAGSAQFQAVNDTIQSEALLRAQALAAEAAARAAEISAEAQARANAVAAEAAARADDVLALTQADLEAGQRLTVLESDLNDNDSGLKAKIATLETTVVDLDNNKAEASEVTAIRSEIDDPATGLKARATSLESRTTAVENGKADAADLNSLEATVTDPSTGLPSKASQTALTALSADVAGKASASDLNALTARVGTAEGEIVSISDAVATETATRTSQINAANSRVDGVEVTLKKIGTASAVTEVAVVEAFTTSRSGDPLTVANLPSSGVVTDSLLGRCYEVTWTAFGQNICTKQLFPIESGRVYRVRITYRVATLPPDGSATFSGIVAGVTTFANPASMGSPFWTDTDTGVKVREFTVSSSPNSATNATFPGSGSTHFRVGLRQSVAETTTVRIYSIEVEDVTVTEARLVSAEASITGLQTTTANLQTNKAEASALTALTAKVQSQAIPGSNMLSNPSFSEKTVSETYTSTGAINLPLGWDNFYAVANGQTTTPYRAGWQVGGVGGTVPTWFPDDTVGFFVQQQNASSNGSSPYYELLSERLPVTPGARYGISMYTGAHRCTVSINTFFYDASGAWISTGTSATGDSTNVAEKQGGKLLADFKLLTRFATAPANARFVRFTVRKGPTSSGSDSWLMALGPQLMQVPEDATTMPPFQDFKAKAGLLNKGIVDAQASIIAESSARASGDAANATSIEQQAARFRAQAPPERPAIADDFSQAFTTFNPGPMTTGTVVNVATEGEVRQFSGASVGHITNRTAIRLIPGATNYVRVRARVTVDGGADNRLALAWRVFDASGTYLGAHAFTWIRAPFVAADGWVEGSIKHTTEQIRAAWPTAAFVKGYAVSGRDNGGSATSATWQISLLRTSAGDANAAVNVLREALATGSSSQARLLLAVNTNTNVATIEAYASEGDGVWNGSKISFTADTIELNGNVLVNGSVLTPKLANNAVSQVSSAYTAGATGASGVGDGWAVWQSLTVTTTGGVLLINAGLLSRLAPYDNDNATKSVRIRRGSTVIYQANDFHQSFFGQDTQQPLSVILTDSPAQGTYTYTLETTNNIAVSNASSTNRALVITELKK